uniref:Ubiquitin conjugating enzyme E2 E3 n=1 Tax=Cyprinus carpio TaxID=7962 RepID=A0A8C1SG72_CYPCA
MSSERQRSDDESPSTSSGSSDADQRDPPVPEPEEQEERKQPTPPQQQKKSTKLSSKTTAKLSSSAKRIQKELAEITLDPPPNCSAACSPVIMRSQTSQSASQSKLTLSVMNHCQHSAETEQLHQIIHQFLTSMRNLYWVNFTPKGIVHPKIKIVICQLSFFLVLDIKGNILKNVSISPVSLFIIYQYSSQTVSKLSCTQKFVVHIRTKLKDLYQILVRICVLLHP